MDIFNVWIYGYDITMFFKFNNIENEKKNYKLITQHRY